MSRLDLHDGDIIRLTSVKNNFAPTGNMGLISTSFKAPKGKVFVAVLLGVEPKDGSAPLDLDGVLDRMGWMKKPEATS